MQTTFEVKSTADNTKSTLYITQQKTNWKQLGFNANEIGYINKKISEKEQLILINRFTQLVYIYLHDKATDYSQSKQLETLRSMGSKICVGLNAHKYAQLLIKNLNDNDELALAVAEGCALTNYQFLKYKSKAEKNTLSKITFVSTTIKKAAAAELEILVDAVCIARDLVNEPQSYLTAPKFADEMKSLGKKSNLQVTVFNKKQIEALKMGGLLAVNQGSQTPPTFTIMEWKPKKPVNKKPIVLVGKGVVYDTGGVSLKPTPNSMDYMKCDMAGGATVAATLYAIANAKLNVHVIGLIPATDNRPGENAYVPGDVIKMHGGQTVEMLNADAEGRLLLADALTFAAKYKPELVFDFATLTGAAAAAIGGYGIVCMGTADEATKLNLKISGNQVHERLVEFPLWDEYDKLLKSDIADMKNIGGPVAGAITAGKFLERYINYPWMHFDIAGPAWNSATDDYRLKNGTGVGVRLMFDFLKKITETN